ncbi:ricin-type beta-trefoil lectin domain protein [Streptomyces sp. NPDC060028]|uniref:ricin-type beta-trefoil lectin domain protein n=1 Tax=Streptomyces sp. NPDC060028 TaxID=3347041 RepID=UPI00369870DC
MAVIAALALLLPMAFIQGFDLGMLGAGKSDWEGRDGQAGHYRFDGKVWKPQKVPATPGVAGHQLAAGTPAGHPDGFRPLGNYQAAAPVWPKAGKATVQLAAAPAASGSSASGSSASGSAPSAAEAAAKPVKAGSLPVWVAPAHPATVGAQTTATAAPAAVHVEVASHDQALKAGANGMLLSLAPVTAPGAPAQVEVVVDYAALAKAYGGGYGSRLQLVRMPACALTTPQRAACRTQTPIPFDNRATADQLTATVPLETAAPAAKSAAGEAAPGARSATATSASTETYASTATFAAAAAAAAEPTTLAVTSGSGGSQGDYAATSLNPSGSWQASGAGSFTYSYPISVPAGLGGNAPSVGLSYDSQAVDGETSARNSQSTWVGDGWGYDPGFVERTYRSCGSLRDGNGDKVIKGSGDNCWSGANAQVSFGPHSGVLVPDTKDAAVPGLLRQWKLRGDDGTIVQELSGAANGLQDGTYFRVLTTDGSAAYFGSGHAPAGVGTAAVPQSAAPTDDSTDSAWGEPVFHPQSGDPCHDAAKGKASRCAKPEGWRWNLDFVVSPNGLVQRYDYTPETNYYSLGGGQAADGKFGTLTSYTRGGALDSISYGYTLADALAKRTPSARVVFTAKQRCQTTSTFTDCSAGNLTDANASHWPDTPWDLHCDSTDSTTIPDGSTTVPKDVCVIAGPTFWSTTRLDSIATQVHVKDAKTDKLVPVDSYQLTHVFSDAGGTVDPVTGTSVDPEHSGFLQAVMWLQTVQHTGKDTYDNGNSDITLNKVAFTGTEIDNRVNDVMPSAPPLYHPRMSGIQTETGESIAVDYNQAPCEGKTLTFAGADSNTESCYPVYWNVPGASKPTADWFNKITVRTVTTSDLTIASTYKPDGKAAPSGSASRVSTYAYAGAAWHRDDSPFGDDQYRTWSQFRGFRTVTVQTGRAPEPVTQTVSTYLQGMDGDYLADGSRRSVTVDAKVNGAVVQSVTDSDQLAGTELQNEVYTAAGGTVSATSISAPFTYTSTATSPQTAWSGWEQSEHPGETKPALSTLPALTAYRMQNSQSHGYERLADGTWRHTRTDTAYDAQGRVSAVDAHGDVTDPTQERCTATAYANAPPGNPRMISYPGQVTEVSGPCAAVTSANLLSDRKIYYAGDGTLLGLGAFGQVSDTAAATGVQIATGFTGSTENWQTTAAMKYDGVGRITDAVDSTGQNTHTDFVPAWSSSGNNISPTTVKTTNSHNWVVSSTHSPLRGLATQNTDTNGRKTEITYDALGRRTAVWMPGRDKGAGQSADRTFSYSLNPGAVAAPGDTVTQPGGPTSVTSRTLREDGTYSVSIAIYDGMLQPRQTQMSPQGDSDVGRIIADTFYDSHGWPVTAYAPYYEPAASPSGTLFAANENQIPSETTTAYDGQGRTLTATLWHQAVEQWHTSTSYPGADETDSTPPAGGRTTASFSNALGQTVRTVVKNTDATVTLHGGDVIPSGTSLASNSVRLTMEADGNLVLTALATGKQIWASGTAGNPGAYAKFGTDGNLVVYTTSNAVKWTTGLAASTGSTFRVRADSTAVVVASNSTTVLWKQGTAGAVPAANATTSYTYASAGQIATVKDSAGNTWSTSYDLLGRPVSQTDPNTGTGTFDKYDTSGNLLQATDTRGQTLSFTYDWNNRRTATYSGPWTATPDPAKKQAGWVYDTLAKGYLTSSTRYVGGASGKAYTQAVTGYNTAYQPRGATVTIPASEGFAAAGQSAAPASGTVTYQTSVDYTPTVGLLSTTHYQADGNLPAEDVDYGYTQQGTLDTFGGYISAANTPAYLSATVHDALGRVQQTNYGPSGKQLATFAQYDSTTGRATQTSSMVQTSATALDVVNYRYNQIGELTAVDDLQNNTAHDTQCFTYDSFQRLTQAWTDTAGITSPSAAPVGAIGGCTTGRVQTTSSGQIKTTTVGGPAPYWQTYTFDQLGDRTGMVNHDASGNALADTTQSIAYAGKDGTVASALPDQAGTTTSGNPADGTATWTNTYTDPANGNKNAGNTMSRKVTTTGPLTTGFTLAGGGKLCIETAGGAATAGTKVQVGSCNGTSPAQKWTIGTDGTVKVLGMCLDTVSNATTGGTLVVIDTCNTDPSQKWKATTTGTLVNVANSAVCLTDPAANATAGTQLTLATCGSAGQVWKTASTGALPAGQTQSFTYDGEGRTATVTTGTGTTSTTAKYLYDADGKLLIQTSAVGGADNTRILYLFGGAEQITLNVAAKTWTGLRHYTGPDGTNITRTSAGAVSYQIGNTQGTATVSVDAGSLTATRRSYDPYGNARGPKPPSWVSPDENRGFLGQPLDASTGLNLLGARNYEATTGRFLSPDPVFQAGDPNQMGGYTYAADNPASGSDASGMDNWYLDPSMNVCAIDCKGPPPTTTTTTTTTVTTKTSSGGHGGGGCSGFWGCVGHYIEKAAPVVVVVLVVVVIAVAVVACTAESGGLLGPACVEGAAVAFVATCGALLGDCGPGPGGEGLSETAREDSSRGAKPSGESGPTGAKGAGPASGAAKEAVRDAEGPAAPKHGTTQEAAETAAASSTRADEASTGNAGTTCSFSPDTEVLLDDGQTKPIAEVTTGDQVEAADPGNGGDAGGRTVVATWAHDDSDLVDLSVEVAPGEVETLHTTSEHPFWDATTLTWVPAGALTSGHALTTPDGRTVHVVEARPVRGKATRYNLTVDELHTYYVLVGGAPVLVHNVCGKTKHSPRCECEKSGQPVRGVSPAEGDTVVLGVASAGNPTAESIGGMTFNSTVYSNFHDDGGGRPQWVNEVDAAVSNPRVGLAVDLGDLYPGQPGISAADAFAQAVKNGRANGWQRGRGTEWEMTRVRYYVLDEDSPRTWESITWYMNGVEVSKDQMPHPEW